MTRLPDENLRALAARYCRILRAVEQAHMLGDEDALISLLAGIDPVDLQSVAAELEAPAATTEQRGGTTLGFSDDGRVDDVVAASPPVASEPAGSGSQPSAPAALNPYSRKVPCS